MKQFPRAWFLSTLIWLLLLLPSSAASSQDPKILHILNRLSFGSKPGDIEKIKQIGINKYIKQQLAPSSIPESPELTRQLQNLETLELTPLQLAQQFGKPQRKSGNRPTPEARRSANQKQGRVLQQSIQARLLRATLSSRQLEEVMVDFWFNHFNVYAHKGLDRIWVGAYEREAIRPHVFGRFRDLLEATARHPAMSFYLDNWRNTIPRNPARPGGFRGLNENYARELMELHTLGVNGGYTQQDVITLAKILTGWGFQQGKTLQEVAPGGFYFNAKYHDFSDKVFLGQEIKGTGEAEGEKALDILASHPSTARRISERLAQYFVADKPPESLVKRLTERYLSTDGNVRQVLETLFDSPEFQDPKYYQAKFKTPYRYVISAVRATGMEVKNVQPMQRTLQQLGMPLYGALAPDGYKNTQEAWLNPDGLGKRIAFATALGGGRVPLTDTLPESSPDKSKQNRASSALDPQKLAGTLGNMFSPKTQEAIAQSPRDLQAALMLGSPEFMKY